MVIVQPSSLIFVVLVAVWAAYFVQYWLRRREHLATARSVEQFSEAMRVLKRSTPLPRADLATPTPLSYAVTPATPSRPRVLVKHAQPAPGVPAGGVSRRVRGISLLVALTSLPVVGALVAFGPVPWWALVGSGVAVVGSFLWLRSAVQASIREHQHVRDELGADGRDGPMDTPHPERAHSASPLRARPASHRSPRVTETAAETAVESAGPRAGTSDEQVAADAEVAVVATTVKDAPPTAEPVAPVAPAARLVDDDDIPLTWDPRPVPPPTYTLKARAEHPVHDPAEVTPAVDPAEVEPADTAYDQERRVAGA